MLDTRGYECLAGIYSGMQCVSSRFLKKELQGFTVVIPNAWISGGEGRA